MTVCNPTKNGIATGIKIKWHFSMAASENKIYFANQSTGVYMRIASTEMHLQADFNGACQGIKRYKKEKRKLLVKPESYPNPE